MHFREWVDDARAAGDMGWDPPFGWCEGWWQGMAYVCLIAGCPPLFTCVLRALPLCAWARSAWPQYARSMPARRPYPSDLSHVRWELVESVLSAWQFERRGRARTARDPGRDLVCGPHRRPAPGRQSCVHRHRPRGPGRTTPPPAHRQAPSPPAPGAPGHDPALAPEPAPAPLLDPELADYVARAGRIAELRGWPPRTLGSVRASVTCDSAVRVLVNRVIDQASAWRMVLSPTDRGGTDASERGSVR